MFCIEVNGKRSSPTPYASIATVKVGERLFGGVSLYWTGYLPGEEVFEIVPVAKEWEWIHTKRIGGRLRNG
jgi:hypothetical protein